MSAFGRAIQESLWKLGSTNSLGDGELLGRFVLQQEEAAFQELVRRHGPMVLRVCQRVLRHAQDSEDAFQATFVVLARKAGSVTRQESVGSWLHRVAFRVALEARGRANRQRRNECQIDGNAVQGNRPQQSQAEITDLQSVVDEEVDRLPEKYRAAVVLHYLEGKSCEEAAQLLRCQASAVKKRLERARERLRVRLERRGMILPVGATLALLTQETASAAMPASLAARTANAQMLAGGGPITANVAVLAEAVLQRMADSRWKAVGVMMAVILTGVGLASWILAPQKQLDVSATGPLKLLAIIQADGNDSLAFSPDGKWLVTHRDTASVPRLWDTTIGRQVREFEDLRGTGLISLQFSTDSKQLAMGRREGPVVVYDLNDGRERSVLPKATRSAEYITNLTFSSDCKWAVGLGNSPTTSRNHRVWDLATGRVQATLDMTVGPCHFSPGGNWLVAVDSRLFETTSGMKHPTLQVKRGFSGVGAVVSPDSTQMAVPSAESVTLYDIGQGKEPVILHGHSETVRAIEFSADGSTVATGAANDHAPRGGAGEIRLWDRTTGHVRHSFREPSWGTAIGLLGMVYRPLFFSPDGRWLFAWDIDHRIILRDVATGKTHDWFQSDKEPVTWVVFSPDGKLLIACSGHQAREGHVESFSGTRQRVWDVASRKELAVLPESSLVKFLANQTLATRCKDGTIKLWSVMRE